MTSSAHIDVLDLCPLDASEPAPMVLAALERLAPGAQLCLLIGREPFALYRQLSDLAYAYCTRVLADALYEVTIWRCAPRQSLHLRSPGRGRV